MTVTDIFDAVTEEASAMRTLLAERRGYRDGENPSGERQLAADVAADERFAERLGALDSVGTYASEERDEPLDTGEGYAVAVDPLDGSSNLPANGPVGTIVGVYDASLPALGRDLVAAGYVLYGPRTTMLVAREDDVTEYLVTEDGREAMREDVTIPEEPTVFGFGGGVDDWQPAFAEYAESVRRELKLRYAGALVADVNQVVTNGGIFAYPALSGRPAGKLRLQFEANPVAYVVETAGGVSSTGHGSILDVEPTDLHQRVPVHVGNRDLIDCLEGGVAR
ncbi:MAG: class 1 fructose-bisphosphatase [Halobacteriaceae archaeon]